MKMYIVFQRFILLILISMTSMASIIAQQNQAEKPIDGVYERITIRERKPVPLPHIREADVVWSKRVWQYIDVRKTINQHLYFPLTPSSEYRNLMQVLEDAIRAGELRAYHVDDDSFEGEPFDPTVLFDELLTGEIPVEVDGRMETEVVPFRSSDVMVFRIKEEWFIDRRRGQLDVRIIGLSPSKYQEQDGVLTGIFDPLFWVPFEEARPALANAPVLSRRNDMHNISFDDLFQRRYFDSVIYREDRPDGRAIVEYIDDPQERLREAERIKESIRNRELDMWHY